MNIFKRIKTYFEDLKAWRRKERRVAPRTVRGRVYEKKEVEGGGPGSAIIFKKQPVAKLTMTVTRADGSTEIITVPAQVTNNG